MPLLAYIIVFLLFQMDDKAIDDWLLLPSSDISDFEEDLADEEDELVFDRIFNEEIERHIVQSNLLEKVIFLSQNSIKNCNSRRGRFQYMLVLKMQYPKWIKKKKKKHYLQFLI